MAKVRNSQRMNDPLVNTWVIAKKCPSQQSNGKNILETVDSETTNWNTRSCNGAFSLSSIGTLCNELLKSVKRLCLPCNMSGDVLENNH